MRGRRRTSGAMLLVWMRRILPCYELSSPRYEYSVLVRVLTRKLYEYASSRRSSSSSLKLPCVPYDAVQCLAMTTPFHTSLPVCFVVPMDDQGVCFVSVVCACVCMHVHACACVCMRACLWMTRECDTCACVCVCLWRTWVCDTSLPVCVHSWMTQVCAYG